MTSGVTSPLVRTLLSTLGLWVWVVPSAYFWHLADLHGIVLPYLPTIVWAPAGELWELSRAAYVLLLALVPLVIHRLTGRARADRRLRRVIWVVAGISIPIALVWGRAIVNASRQH